MGDEDLELFPCASVGHGNSISTKPISTIGHIRSSTATPICRSAPYNPFRGQNA
jgi:hypothetical protein